MIVIARGSLPQPDAPDIDDEMLVVDRLKAGGLMTTAYSRAATSATTGLFGDPHDRTVRQRPDLGQAIFS
jgi:hypothetical protein